MIDANHAYNSFENRAAGSVTIPTYLCPSTTTATDRRGPNSGDINGNDAWDPGDDLAWIDFGGMFGVGDPALDFMNGVMIYERPISTRDIVDGLSRTIIVGEDSARGTRFHGQWINGQNIFDQTGAINRAQNNELFSDHPGGVQVVLCDGSVHFLSEDIEVSTLFALCTRALGELAGL